jgi:FixJ family two-component response regulator
MSARENVIAVVDDSDIVRDALDQFLASCGYRTELYASAEEFLQSATVTLAACLVVDVDLGDLSGPELLCTLAARGLHFPVILMSGSGDTTLDNRAVELGCLKFLRKPFAPTHLLEAIAQGLSDSRPVR